MLPTAKYSIEYLNNSETYGDFDNKFAIRINDEIILVIPLFTFYRDEDNEDEIKYKVTSMHLVTDIKKVNHTHEKVDTLEKAFRYILNSESMYQSCDLDIESVICLSETSLSAQEYFEQEQEQEQ